MKRRMQRDDGSYVYRTTVSGTKDNDVYIEVFRSKEEMENNAAPFQILTSFDELLDFNE